MKKNASSLAQNLKANIARRKLSKVKKTVGPLQNYLVLAKLFLDSHKMLPDAVGTKGSARENA